MNTYIRMHTTYQYVLTHKCSHFDADIWIDGQVNVATCTCFLRSQSNLQLAQRTQDLVPRPGHLSTSARH